MDQISKDKKEDFRNVGKNMKKRNLYALLGRWWCKLIQVLRRTIWKQRIFKGNFHLYIQEGKCVYCNTVYNSKRL